MSATLFCQVGPFIRLESHGWVRSHWSTNPALDLLPVAVALTTRSELESTALLVLVFLVSLQIHPRPWRFCEIFCSFQMQQHLMGVT